MNISECRWSYPTSDFNGRVDDLRALLQHDCRVTFIDHERLSKDRQEISSAERLPRVDFLVPAASSAPDERRHLLAESLE